MILFLDAVSPVPKFVITDNNKVIESLLILDQNCTKISDSIYGKFIILQRKHNLLDQLDHLIVCIGPGSYTSLRVGISFMLGISYSKKVPIYGISGTELLGHFIIKKEFYNTFIIICSTNNQNFICLPVNHKNCQYKIMNIIDQYSFDNIDFGLYSKCIANFNLPDFLKKQICTAIKSIEYINFEDKLHENFLMVPNDETVLKPIYISDNKLFD